MLKETSMKLHRRREILEVTFASIFDETQGIEEDVYTKIETPPKTSRQMHREN